MTGKTPKTAEPILIVCEGVTELSYLLELSRFMGIADKVDIRCADYQCPDLTVEQLAKDRFWAKATGMPYAQEVWLVFDRDRHAGYRKAVKLAQRLGMRLALSRPCIEYWWLLHFSKAPPEFEKDGRVVYKSTVTDADGIVTETTVVRYEPVTPPDECLKALKQAAKWYCKTKICFLAYFGSRTGRAYARAKALGSDPFSPGSGLADLIDRFCELAGMTPEELFDAFEEAAAAKTFFAAPDIEDRFLPPEVGHLGRMIEILAKGERAITEEEWLSVGNTAEMFALWARRVVLNRTSSRDQKELTGVMQTDAEYIGEIDLESALRTLTGIIAAHDGDFGRMTNACLQTLFGVLGRIREAARRHVP